MGSVFSIGICAPTQFLAFSFHSVRPVYPAFRERRGRTLPRLSSCRRATRAGHRLAVLSADKICSGVLALTEAKPFASSGHPSLRFACHEMIRRLAEYFTWCARFTPPFVRGGAGLSFDSFPAVAGNGLGTASRLRLLAKFAPAFSS